MRTRSSRSSAPVRHTLVALSLGLACSRCGSGSTTEYAAPPLPDAGLGALEAGGGTDGTDATVGANGADGAATPDGAVVSPDVGTPDAPAVGPALQISASQTGMPNMGGNPLVMAQYLMADSGGTTSLRLQSNKPTQTNPFPVGAPNNNHIAPPSEQTVEERDRDLGQTFFTTHAFTVDSVYLRVGPSSQAVLAGAPGANVALQFFEVQGTPTLNDSGTPGFLKDGSGNPVFDRAKSPQLDDYFEGETYQPLALAQGLLPAQLNANDYLTFRVIGGPIALQKNKGYAFVLLFTDRAADRSMSLANAYFGAYLNGTSNQLIGHAIRREGGSGPSGGPFFMPDLPDDFAVRTAQPPGTLGFPDVDTFRTLSFTITAVAGSVTN